MIRESSGSSKRHADINQTTQAYPSNYTILEYYESNAQILLIY